MSRRTLTLAPALALAVAGCAARGVPVKTPPAAPRRARLNVRPCDTREIERWSRMRCGGLGVAAEDSGRNLDPAPPVRGQTPPPPVLIREGNAVDGFHTWVAVSGLKETACGRPEGYEENCATSLGLFAECDFNNDVRPDPGSLLAQYLELMQCRIDGEGNDDVWPEGQPMLCFERDVLHAEITPPQSPALHPYGLRRELRRLWSPGPGRDAWQAQLWDGRMCVYGPFVGDRGQNFKPEIHPAQLVWWNLWPPGLCREARGPDGPFALLLMQDASVRFSEEHHFYLRSRPAERWRPWAEGPVDGTFHIAFWARPEDPPTFSVVPLFAELPAIGLPRDVVDARGGLLLRIDDTRLRGELPGYAGVEVDVERACRDPADDALLGVLRVRARAGTGHAWEEGHAALRVVDSRAPAAAAQAAAAGRRAPEDEPDEDGTEADDALTRLDPPDKPLEEAPAKRAACTGLCPKRHKGAPPTRSEQPELHPRIALRDEHWERVGTSGGDERARASMLIALADEPGAVPRLRSLPEVPVVALRRFVLQALDDVATPGSEEPRALDREPPPHVTWTIAVRDAVSGVALAPDAVRVTANGARCMVEIAAGEPAAVYAVEAELRVAGRFTDTRDGRTHAWSLERTRRQRFWTHALAVAGTAGDVGRLTQLLRGHGARRNRDYDRLLDAAAARAVADGRVSVSELRLLARQAGLASRAKRGGPSLERTAPLDDLP